jgi:hypothetical protein
VLWATSLEQADTKFFWESDQASGYQRLPAIRAVQVQAATVHDIASKDCAAAGLTGSRMLAVQYALSVLIRQQS